MSVSVGKTVLILHLDTTVLLSAAAQTHVQGTAGSSAGCLGRHADRVGGPLESFADRSSFSTTRPQYITVVFKKSLPSCIVLSASALPLVRSGSISWVSESLRVRRLSVGDACFRVCSTCSRLFDSYSSASCSFFLAFFSFFNRF